MTKIRCAPKHGQDAVVLVDLAFELSQQGHSAEWRAGEVRAIVDETTAATLLANPNFVVDGDEEPAVEAEHEPEVPAVAEDETSGDEEHDDVPDHEY